MRLCLDTNVWTLLGERGETSAFDALAASRDFEVVVPPATLLEGARTPTPARRRVVLGAMTSGRRTYLRTEAAEESAEFVNAVRKYRPEWLRPIPHRLSWVKELDRFWTHRLPQRLKYDPEGYGDALNSAPASRREHRVVESLSAMQKLFQDEVRSTGVRLDLRNLWASPAATPAGEAWLGLPPAGRVEEWRFTGANYYWAQLGIRPSYGGRDGSHDSTVADWVDPWVDPKAVRQDREDFNRFWFSAVSSEDVPRQWLRAVLPRAQVEYKVTSSNPFDEQQVAYLFDTDLYLTADRRLTLAVARVRAAAPFSFASVAYVEQAESSLTVAIERAMDAAP